MLIVFRARADAAAAAADTFFSTSRSRAFIRFTRAPHLHACCYFPFLVLALAHYICARFRHADEIESEYAWGDFAGRFTASAIMLTTIHGSALPPSAAPIEGRYPDDGVREVSIVETSAERHRRALQLVTAGDIDDA